MRKRTYIIASLILALCLTGCMTRTRWNSNSWDTFQKDMLEKYSDIRQLKAELGPPSLFISCYCGDISDNDMDTLKADLKSFLSSEEFLTEYVAYGHEKAEKNTSSFGLMEDMPTITISIYPNGSTSSAWDSEARYYTKPYRSDRIMEIDNYQTWDDWDRSE